MTLSKENELNNNGHSKNDKLREINGKIVLHTLNKNNAHNLKEYDL